MDQEKTIAKTKSKAKPDNPRMEWVLTPGAVLKADDKWDLMYGVSSKTGKRRIVATVYANGAWFTWDRNGIGGENWKEDSVDKAKSEAKAAAISQGFV